MNLMMIARCFKFISISIISILIIFNSTYASELSNQKNHFITQQQWSIPKKAKSILAIPALQSVMNILSNKSSKMLLVKYPGGDVGVLWASELKAWLVALGLTSSRIELQSGSTSATQLELIIY